MHVNNSFVQFFVKLCKTYLCV